MVFDKFQNKPQGEPQEHHLDEVLKGRSKSKFNIILSYSIVPFFSSGFHKPNYLEIKKILFQNSWLQCSKLSNFQKFLFLLRNKFNVLLARVFSLLWSNFKQMYSIPSKANLKNSSFQLDIGLHQLK